MKNTNKANQTPHHLLYQDTFRRAVLIPDKILKSSNGVYIYKDWEIHWEVANTDLTGNVTWYSDETGFDITKLHTQEEWEDLSVMAKQIAEKLKTLKIENG